MNWQTILLLYFIGSYIVNFLAFRFSTKLDKSRNYEFKDDDFKLAFWVFVFSPITSIIMILANILELFSYYGINIKKLVDLF